MKGISRVVKRFCSTGNDVRFCTEGVMKKPLGFTFQPALPFLLDQLVLSSLGGRKKRHDMVVPNEDWRLKTGD